MPDSTRFFKRFGHRLRQLREARDWSIDDMEVRGIGAKHWQQFEAGRPITVKTLLRVCEALNIKASVLLDGLDEDIYQELPLPSPRKKRRKS